MATTSLGDKAVGSIVKLYEGTTLADFYVAKQDYESALNGTGRTLLVRKACYTNRIWHGSYVNAYATSAINTWLVGTYKQLLAEDIQALMGETKFYYTIGNTNKTVTTLSRSVFLLSLRELGLTASNANSEGSALPIASTLNTTSQWTRSPATDDGAYSWYVGSGTAKAIRLIDALGARPAFTLPAYLAVGADGTVYTDTSATITLTTPLPADDTISVMVMTLVGDFPEDANLEVLVTNNALDDSPVWEDATPDIRNGNNHVFVNQTAVNGFAFNFRLSASRGESFLGGYISNIGGAFE